MKKQLKVGDYVKFKIGVIKFGKIIRIDGAYHIVKDFSIPGLSWELYPIEMQMATENELMLYRLEQ
jgi:hypothetical protein